MNFFFRKTVKTLQRREQLRPLINNLRVAPNSEGKYLRLPYTPKVSENLYDVCGFHSPLITDEATEFQLLDSIDVDCLIFHRDTWRIMLDPLQF